MSHHVLLKNTVLGLGKMNNVFVTRGTKRGLRLQLYGRNRFEPGLKLDQTSSRKGTANLQNNKMTLN